MTRIPALLLATAAVAALAGCTAAPADSPYPDVSLAQTKSTVQLLRNDAASRVDEALVDIVLGSGDLSVACESEADDPDGTIRSWESTARLRLQLDTDLDDAVDTVVQSYVDEGWTASGSGARTELSRANLYSSVVIVATPQDDELEHGPEISIALAGPCVVTEGQSSSEVRTLEAMAF